MRNLSAGRALCVSLAAMLLAAIYGAPPVRATTYDVTQYGAVPNGVVDDTAAINNLINAASAGDTIYFPAGVYCIGASIVPKSGVAIAGAGQDSSVVAYASGSGAMQPMVKLGTAANVQISGLTLDGRNSPGAWVGIQAGDSPGINIHDLRIQNLNASQNGWGPFGVEFTGHTTASTIANTQIRNIAPTLPGGGGIQILSCSGIQITNNLIVNTGGNGISGWYGDRAFNCDNFVVTGNTVAGSGKLNPLTYACGSAITLLGNNNLVQNNVVDSWLSIIGSNIAIRNNVISDPSTPNRYVGIEGAVSDGVVSGNSFLAGDAGGVAIDVGGSSLIQRAYWAHNSFQSGIYGGINFYASKTGLIKQVYLYDNAFVGTTNGSGVGLYASSTTGSASCTNIDFDSNVIAANNGDAIRTSGAPGAAIDNLRVVNNVIVGNNGKPWNASGGSYLGANLLWQDNTVMGNANDGAVPTSSGTYWSSPPAVSILASATTATVGATVNFSLLSFSDSSGLSIANYLWDLGDGLPATTSTASFAYATPGVYDVGLVVWDSLGRAARGEVQIVVAAGAGMSAAIAPDLGVAVPEPSSFCQLAALAISAALCAAWRRKTRNGSREKWSHAKARRRKVREER